MQPDLPVRYAPDRESAWVAETMIKADPASVRRSVCAPGLMYIVSAHCLVRNIMTSRSSLAPSSPRQKPLATVHRRATTAAQVFQEYAPRVYGLARRILDNESDAEDVASAVLLQVIPELDTLGGKSSLVTWLDRVTTNAARKRAVQPTEPQQVLGSELVRVIEAATAELPATYREVFVLADVEGIGNAPVGERLGLSMPEVKSRLHHARLLMRQALAEPLA